ncbi:MAG: hypothetical protein IPK59_20315 [Rhodospirillaceae bacterium]|nr:hypothetical protein [Rhodospirillaceae bacterium]
MNRAADSTASLKLETFEDWQHCITQICGIPLTPAFVEERIAALENPRSSAAEKFEKTWGRTHREKVVAWFKTAREQLADDASTPSSISGRPS